MNFIKDRKRNGILLFLSVALSIALAVLIALKFKIGYADVDDITIRDIATGAYTGAPDAHLFTIMYPFGLMLKALYSLSSTIPWLDAFAVLFVFAAFLAIVWRIGSIGETMFLKIVGMLLSASIVLILYLKYIVSLKFFAISLLLAATAILWAATTGAVKGENSPGDEAFVIILFLVFSLMLDYRAFTISAPFALFAVAFSFIRSEIEEMGNLKKKRRIGKHIAAWAVPTAVCVGMVVGIFLWNKASYADGRILYRSCFADFNIAASFKQGFSAEIFSLGKALFAFTNSLCGLVGVVVSTAAVSVCFVKRDKTGTIVATLGIIYEFAIAGVLYLNDCLNEDVSFALAFYTVLFEAGVLLRGYVRGLKKELASEFKSVEFADIYSPKPEDRKLASVTWALILGIPCALFLLFAGAYTYTSVCNENVAYIQKADTWSDVSSEFDRRNGSIFMISESYSDMVTVNLFSGTRGVQSRNFYFMETIANDTTLGDDHARKLGVSNLNFAPAEKNNIYLVCDSVEQASAFADFLIENGYENIHLSDEVINSANGIKTVLGRYLR